MSDPTGAQQTRPLRRLRVLDLTRLLGGATGAQILFLSVPLILGSVLAITYVDTAAGTNIELSLAAVTLLTEGMIGNPYGFPTGPTAHVSPLPVLWVAGVYRLFGVYTPTARMVLSGFNTFCHVAACALAIGICRRTCRTGAAIWFAVIVICLVPVTLFGDVVSYRAYEQAFAAMILMLGGYLFVCYRDRPNRASQPSYWPWNAQWHSRPHISRNFSAADRVRDGARLDGASMACPSHPRGLVVCSGCAIPVAVGNPQPD
jgi:hypothetical protein